MRGTALRDSLDFVSFNDFKNQIDYAQFGKAFNQYAVRTVLSDLPRDSLVGRSVVGARSLHARIRRSASARHTRAVEAWTGVVTEVRDDDVILRLEGVTKVYSGTVAVKQADFDVRRGAVNVLVGENGAGKSTLMKIIAGVESPTMGRILLDGKPVVFADSADAAANGVGIVFQELNLFGNLSVAENIFAARELTRGVLGIDHRLARATRGRVAGTARGRHRSAHPG